MSIFIYEHLTSGALAGEAFSPGLMQEGDAMLKAISSDLTALGSSVCLMRDSRLPSITDPSGLITVLPVSSQSEYQQVWQHSLLTHQNFMVIAPETGGVLNQLVLTLEKNKKQHYGSGSEAIATCADKLKCCQWLQQQAIATPDTYLAQDWLAEADQHAEQEWIIKPIDGAGCEMTFRVDNAQARDYLSLLSNELMAQTIVQPFIPGVALSLSAFIDDTQIHLLSVNRQHILETDHQLSLQHCEPGHEDLVSQREASQLLRQIRATMPALWGFIGIDLVKSADQLWVIEINPRLTSSYAEPAFRKHANPAVPLHQYINS